MRRLPASQVYWMIQGGMGLITSTIFTLNLVYHVTVVALNPLQLVLVGAMLESSVFLFELPTGVVADVYSRRLSTIIGMLVMGGGFLIEGSCPTFAGVLLAQFVWGLGWTFISGACNAWIADEVGAENVGPIYLRGAQLGQLGGLLGIPISVAMGSVALAAPILAGGAAFILLGLFLVLAMPETGFKPHTESAASDLRQALGEFRATLGQGLHLVRNEPRLLLYLLIVVCVGLSSEGYDRLWTPHFLQNLRFPAWGLSDALWFGLLRGGSAGLTLLFTEVAVRRQMDPRALSRMLQAMYALMVLGALGLAWAGNFWLALCAYWFFSTLRHTAEPLENAWINQHIESSVRATVLSLTSQGNSLGQIVGGPVVGWIGMTTSLRVALSVAAGWLVPVVGLYGKAAHDDAPGAYDDAPGAYGDACSDAYGAK